MMAFLLAAGCSAPTAPSDASSLTPSVTTSTTPSGDPEGARDGMPDLALADDVRPAAPEPPACMTSTGPIATSGLEGVVVNATERTPEASIEDAKTGIIGAQRILAACLGGDVPVEARSPLYLDLRSSYAGDERHPVPWEAFANKDGAREARIRADVNGTDGFPDAGWTFRADRQKTFAHEYTHIWHQLTGCGGAHPPVPAWFAEGLADYVGYHAGIVAGNITREDARTFLWRVAFFDGQLDARLSQLQKWPGHVGFFAIEELVAQAGNDPSSVRRLCETISESMTPNAFAEAFPSAFGVTLDEFERGFFARHGRTAA